MNISETQAIKAKLAELEERIAQLERPRLEALARKNAELDIFEAQLNEREKKTLSLKSKSA